MTSYTTGYNIIAVLKREDYPALYERWNKFFGQRESDHEEYLQKKCTSLLTLAHMIPDMFYVLDGYQAIHIDTPLADKEFRRRIEKLKYWAEVLRPDPASPPVAGTK